MSDKLLRSVQMDIFTKRADQQRKAIKGYERRVYELLSPALLKMRDDMLSRITDDMNAHDIAAALNAYMRGIEDTEINGLSERLSEIERAAIDEVQRGALISVQSVNLKSELRFIRRGLLVSVINALKRAFRSRCISYRASDEKAAEMARRACRDVLKAYDEHDTELASQNLAFKTYNKTFKQAAIELGYQCVWMAGAAECEACQSMNGTVMDGAVRYPPMHSGCRCVLVRGQRALTQEADGANKPTGDKELFANARFANNDLRDEHAKHLPEYGNISIDEYIEIADALLQAEPNYDILRLIRKHGDVVKYRKSTNDFAVGSAKGNIRTMFKPTDGIKYWENEVSKNGK